MKHFLDLRGVLCPLNYVKAKLVMEEVDDGETFEFWLDEGEPIKNVPRSLKDDGHRILEVEKTNDYFRLLVKKGGHF